MTIGNVTSWWFPWLMTKECNIPKRVVTIYRMWSPAVTRERGTPPTTFPRKACHQTLRVETLKIPLKISIYLLQLTLC